MRTLLFLLILISANTVFAQSKFTYPGRNGVAIGSRQQTNVRNSQIIILPALINRPTINITNQLPKQDAAPSKPLQPYKAPVTYSSDSYIDKYFEPEPRKAPDKTVHVFDDGTLTITPRGDSSKINRVDHR